MGIILCQACCFVCFKRGCREKQHQPCATRLSPNLTPTSEQSWSTEIRRVGWGYCEYWCSLISLFLLFLFPTYIVSGFCLFCFASRLLPPLSFATGLSIPLPKSQGVSVFTFICHITSTPDPVQWPSLWLAQLPRWPLSATAQLAKRIITADLE